MQARPNKIIQSVNLNEGQVRKLNALANTEDVAVSAIIRAFVDDGLANFEAAHGPISVDSVGLFTRRTLIPGQTHGSKGFGDRALSPDQPSSEQPSPDQVSTTTADVAA